MPIIVEREFKTVAVLYWGSFDTSGCTVGDYLAADSVRSYFIQNGFLSHLFTVSEMPFSKTLEVCLLRYDAIVFVCGPFLTENRNFKKLVEVASRIPTFALGVSRLKQSIFGGVEAYLRDCETNGLIGFDFAASHPIFDKIKPLIHLPEQKILACLRGEQTEYQTYSKHEVLEKAVADLNVNKFIDTRLNLGIDLPSQVIQILHTIRNASFVISSRLHGSILSGALGIPFGAVDQIGELGKVNSHFRQGFSENLIETIDLENSISSLIDKYAQRPSLRSEIREKIIAKSKMAMETTCEKVIENLN